MSRIKGSDTTPEMLVRRECHRQGLRYRLHRKDLPGKPDLVFPIIHAFFGDSASANLYSEIAVFAEQCYQKRDILMDKNGVKSSLSQAPERIRVEEIPSKEHKTETVTEKD